MVKRLRKLAIWLILLSVTLFIGLVVFVSVYEDEVKSYAVDQIATSLKSDVSVQQIDLSLIDRFPNVSLRFSDVLIEETFDTKDTLIYGELIYLEFNLLDFLKGNYSVNKVTLVNAGINLKRGEDGTDNYHFWNTGNGTSHSLSFQLESVEAQGVHFSMEDRKADLYIDAFVDEADISGAFKDEILLLDCTGQIHVENLSLEDVVYASEKEMLFSGLVEVDQKQFKYSIQHAAVSVNEVPLMVDGSFTDDGQYVYCDLKVGGDGIRLNHLVQNLPEFVKSDLSGYASDGQVDLDLEISGNAGNGAHPNFKADFSILNGYFKHSKSGIKISSIAAKGKYSRKTGEREKLTITQFSGKMPEGEFSISGGIIDLSSPELDLAIEGVFNLDELRQFAEIETLESLFGRASIDATISGKISNMSRIGSKDLTKLKANGHLSFKEVSLQIKGSKNLFESLSGEFELKNRDAVIQSFSGLCGASDFSVTGVFENFVPWAVSDYATLKARTTLYANNLNLSDWMGSAEVSKSEEAYSFQIPERLDMQAKLDIDNLMFREFRATDIAGSINIKNRMIVIDPVEFTTCRGQIFAVLRFDDRLSDGILMKCETKIDKVDVQELFYEFEGFGQDFLTSEHLRGTLNAEGRFETKISRSLNIDSKSIRSDIAVNLSNGELIGLKSMKAIADYLREHKLISPFVDADKFERELDHIRFSALSNVVQISNGVINIPEMLIASSAMDIAVQGWHSFENDIDYSIQFDIRDILVDKSHTEFGTVEDDGLGQHFFLSMEGNIEDPQFGYDRIAAKDKRKEQFQEEKQVFKSLIQEEFRRDKSTQKDTVDTSTTHQPKIIVNWGDKPKKDQKKDDDNDLFNDDDDF